MKTMPTSIRQRLAHVRNGLLDLHKKLLESERALYDHDVQPITSTGQYLDLVMNDPWFEWLRTLSGFIVMIDEAVASKKQPITDEQAAAFFKQAREMLRPSAEGDAFARRYHEVLQRDPSIVLAHGEMMARFTDAE
jgi:hypothetical protein